MSHKEDIEANYDACLFSLGIDLVFVLSLALMLVFFSALTQWADDYRSFLVG